MSVRQLTDRQIELRLNWVEEMIQAERDPKNLPALNDTFQKLLDEQVRRDLEKEDANAGVIHDNR